MGRHHALAVRYTYLDGAKDLSTRDVADYAAGELEYHLTKAKQAEVVPTVSVEEAMAGKPVFQVKSQRDVTRVLFISTDIELLNPTTQTLDGYVEIADLFDEVHILVMRLGLPPKNPVLRASEKVWIYTAAAKYWWQLPGVGFQVITDQLAFAAGFRPDLVVARDPIESAWLAHKVAKAYNRPAQLHIVEDYTTTEFRDQLSTNFFRRFVTKFTIQKFSSVRTLTDKMAKKIEKKFNPTDLKVLPRLQNYEALIQATAEKRLAKTYQGLAIFILYIGDLTPDSGAFLLLKATKFILNNQRIGLIVIGDGPAKSELQKLAKSLGVHKQVIFEPAKTDLLSYLKESHMLVMPDTTTKSEEFVLQGAAAGIPLLVAPTEKRNDVFVDKHSAYFIDPSDSETVTAGISDILNDVEGRAVMAKNAQDTVQSVFHFDRREYKTAYRLSIEEALFTTKAPTDDQ